MTMTPLPGDPHAVRSAAQSMIDAAQRMKHAAKLLSDVGHDRALESKAIDKLRDNAREVAMVVTHASVRYEGAGHALAAYAPRLEAAQKQAKQAIAQMGTTDIGRARDAVHRAELDPWEHVTLSEEEKANRAVDVANARAELAEQERVAAGAHALYEDAKRDVEVAAHAAMAKIQAANESSTLNDRFWDNWNGLVDRYVAPFLEGYLKFLEVVSEIAGLIALVLAFFPPAWPFALAFKVISLAASVQALAITFYLAVLGKRTWGDVLKKAITTAVGVVTKGTKLVSKAAKGAATKVLSKEAAKDAREDLYKFAIDKGWKYGAKAGAQDWDVEHDLNIYRAVVDPEYRDDLGPGNYVGEVVSFATGPIDWLADETGNVAGGLVDDHVPGATSTNLAQLATQDVHHQITADFSAVDTEQIMADNFGSGADRGYIHRGGGGGGW